MCLKLKCHQNDDNVFRHSSLTNFLLYAFEDKNRKKWEKNIQENLFTKTRMLSRERRVRTKCEWNFPPHWFFTIDNNYYSISRTTSSEANDVADLNYPRKFQLGLAAAGFVISAFIIFCGLLVLVRFWVYTNFWYNLFVASMLITGVVFNVSSINMLLVQFDVIWFWYSFVRFSNNSNFNFSVNLVFESILVWQWNFNYMECYRNNFAAHISRIFSTVFQHSLRILQWSILLGWSVRWNETSSIRWGLQQKSWNFLSRSFHRHRADLHADSSNNFLRVSLQSLSATEIRQVLRNLRRARESEGIVRMKFHARQSDWLWKIW